MHSETNIWQEWREATEDLLFFSMESRFARIIGQADQSYRGEETAEVHPGLFEDYLLYEYRHNGLTFADMYRREARAYSAFFEAVRQSYFCGFEVIRYENHVFLKDIFTKRDFSLLNPEAVEGVNFLVGRLIVFDGGHILSPNFESCPKESMEAFKRAILERHAHERPTEDLEDFLSKNALLMMRYLDILDTILEEAYSEAETLFVHQATYLHQSLEGIKAALDAASDCEQTLDEPEDLIYKLIDGGDILSEIVLMKNKVVLECITAEALIAAKGWFEALLGERIVHFADEVLSMEDLLES